MKNNQETYSGNLHEYSLFLTFCYEGLSSKLLNFNVFIYSINISIINNNQYFYQYASLKER